MTEIKPCPFCNGEATVTMRHCDDGQPWLWKCNGPCFLERINSGPTRDEAIARFNVRAQADVVVAQPVDEAIGRQFRDYFGHITPEEAYKMINGLPPKFKFPQAKAGDKS